MISAFDSVEPLQDWFFELTGFEEPRGRNAGNILRKKLLYDHTLQTITSIETGRVMVCGKLSTPSWRELAGDAFNREIFTTNSATKMTITAVKDDIQEIHLRPENDGSVIQVASQFNLLEMTSPLIKPSDGITRYQSDYTQGPACAIACGAGTLYRNYYAQEDEHQIECLEPFADELNAPIPLWETDNGYVILSKLGARFIAEHLENRQKTDTKISIQIKVGLQENTEVTLKQAGHRVTQVYCSAIPIAYHPFETQTMCIPFANEVLTNAYECTLLVGMLQQDKGIGNNKVFLTLLGAGAFGNRRSDILISLKKALRRFCSWSNLEVIIVCYSDEELLDVQQLVNEFS